MTISLDEFAQQIVTSSLISPDEVSSLLTGTAGRAKPADAEGFARLLVQQKRLTPFQVEQLFAWKGISLVLGNYVILDKLGQGGMGMVLKAEHRRMKRVVALKVLSPAVSGNPDMARRFQREVEAAAKLEHPHIVTAHDADEANGTHFLVMQYIDGIDLAALVETAGPMSVAKAISSLVQAARGLEYAHQRGVVHRDIKPANLLLDRHGVIKILDMGLARLDSAGRDQAQLTGTGEMMGTVDYMSPEQAMDSKTVDARSDIYSLGITLWYLLTGRAVYDGDTVVQKLMAHQNKSISPLCLACPHAPPELEAVFTRMVAKTLDARYQSMSEVISALESIVIQPDSTAAPMIATGPDDESRLNQFFKDRSRSAGSAWATRVAIDNSAVTAAVVEPTVMMPSTAGDAQPGSLAPRVGPPGLQAVGPERTAPPYWSQRKAGLAVILTAFAIGAVTYFLTRQPQLPANPAAERFATAVQPPAETVGAASPIPVPPGSPPPAIAPFSALQARTFQADWAAALQVPVEFTNSLGMKFALIPAGEFTMGSPPDEIEIGVRLDPNDRHIQACFQSEGPRHAVVLTKPCYLAVCEVTQTQYAEVQGHNPSGFAATGRNPQYVTVVENLDTSQHPVESVAWEDAAQFCERLSERERLQPFYRRQGDMVTAQKGNGYRLPTEAEWEFACRAGTTTKYWSGDTIQDLMAVGWFDATASGRTHPVGELDCNPFGLYDTHGNVFEWVQDWWAPS